MLRTNLFVTVLLCAACGTADDPVNNHGKQLGHRVDRPKIILAYEVKRQPGENLRSISQRYHVPVNLIEQFNPREGHGRRKNIIYVPISDRAALKRPSNRKPTHIVKLMRDSFMRPIKLGDWSALEEEHFMNLDEWFLPDESQRLSFPVEGYISSGFSWRWNRFHKGVDIAARAGTPIVAAQDGRVAFRGWKAGFGLLVILEHKQGRTYYAHCQSTLVKRGQRVTRGDLIARVGATGQSRGTHLHFEYRDDKNQPIDPTPFLMPPCSRPVALTAQTGRDAMGGTSWSARTPRCQTSDI